MILEDKPRTLAQRGLSVPKILTPPIYAHTVRHTGTKLGMMIKLDDRRMFYRADHAAGHGKKL